MKKLLNSNSLKIIAIFAMLLDHIAYYFFSPYCIYYYVFRTKGRVTAPIMLYCLTIGFCHTKSKFKYAMRLLIFAAISQIPFSLFCYNKLFVLSELNIIFTLFLGIILMISLYDIKNIYLKISLLILCLVLSCFCEYGLFAMSLILIFSMCKDRKWQYVLYSFSCLFFIVFTVIFEQMYLSLFYLMGLFLTIPLLHSYNGNKGKLKLKYLFYIFYPIHFVILILLKSFLL